MASPVCLLPWLSCCAFHPLPSPSFLRSTKRQQQALLLVASTHSALAALPPAASNLGVFGPACNEVLPWLSQPNRLIDDPALLRQLINLAALALDRWLQVRQAGAGLFALLHLRVRLLAVPLVTGLPTSNPPLLALRLYCSGPRLPCWSRSAAQDIRRAADRAAAGCHQAAPGGCLPGAHCSAGPAGALRCRGWPGGRGRAGGFRISLQPVRRSCCVCIL